MFSAEKSDPTPVPPELWGCFPWIRLADVVVPRMRRLQANYSCNLFRTSSTYMPTVLQRYRQTDRRTDGRQTTYDSNATNFALRASRGKTVTPFRSLACRHAVIECRSLTIGEKMSVFALSDIKRAKTVAGNVLPSGG